MGQDMEQKLQKNFMGNLTLLAFTLTLNLTIQWCINCLQRSNSIQTTMAAIIAFEEKTIKNVDVLGIMGYDLASVSGTP